MGFALWIGKELAWAQGRHEYRPMGVAVIASTDLFAPRDFRPRRREPKTTEAEYAGMFASLGHVNGYLQRRRRSVRKPVAFGIAQGGGSIPVSPDSLYTGESS